MIREEREERKERERRERRERGDGEKRDIWVLILREEKEIVFEKIFLKKKKRNLQNDQFC